MPSIRISKDFTSGIYYLTFTVRNWYYLFDRHNRFDILADSLQYCQKHKGLSLYSYVFMLNHIHVIASSPDMIGFVRDFKKFTSKDTVYSCKSGTQAVCKQSRELGMVVCKS